ncbi:MAG: hypothetical protein M0Z58_05385 [Nitrospiraceae bacterium]|nr:hypothetical protein [Nitrospiraceae bacterium]
MVVGHMPYLGRLAALLLCGNSQGRVVESGMGGVVCLKMDSAGWVQARAVTLGILKG